MNILYIPKKKIVLANSNYGLLYNFPAIIDTREIAPVGWHTPFFYDDWRVLGNFVSNNTWNNPGGYLKETGYTHWNSPNTGASNAFGFNGVGSGFRTGSGQDFFGLKDSGYYWQADQTGNWKYGIQVLSNLNAYLSGSNSANMPLYGCALRFVKDDDVESPSKTVTGNDGKVYRTVTIGTQVWMAENSQETKYRNGDAIPEVTDKTAWIELTTGALCAYNNDWNFV